ncbi:MAG: metal ABC transporter ATP-binding protein [Opitutales bacterium]
MRQELRAMTRHGSKLSGSAWAATAARADRSGAPEVAVCFEGVSFRYDASRVLEDADFDIFPGESVCVIGPNGGGKSTLLKLMLGLLLPETGSVRLLGGPPKETRQRVGYVPQQINVDPLFPVSVMDVVLMGALRGMAPGFRSRKERERAGESLELVGLENKAQARFASLSGGQKQAALIARALVGDPEVLLLDEPTAHVDAAAEERLTNTLRSLRGGLTMVTVSHDLAFVSRSVPKVICVNRSVRLHPTAELTREHLESLYGGGLRAVMHDREHLDSHGGHRHA